LREYADRLPKAGAGLTFGDTMKPTWLFGGMCGFEMLYRGLMAEDLASTDCDLVAQGVATRQSADPKTEVQAFVECGFETSKMLELPFIDVTVGKFADPSIPLIFNAHAVSISTTTATCSYSGASRTARATETTTERWKILRLGTHTHFFSKEPTIVYKHAGNCSTSAG
jgi:hypothetical protein